MIRIALFSDIHGKILLPFKLVDLYQKETGNKIDFILQCGDIGAFSGMENLDKATIKHARYDRDELGFIDDFMKVNESIKSFLDQLNISMICVRGNHEDHNFLDSIENEHPHDTLFPIDVYKRVFVCKSGLKQELRKGNDVLSFIGIGRIGDRKGRSEKQFIQEYERQAIRKLFKTKDVFDVLISHDKDDTIQRGYGMKEIREVLDNVVIQYHFYGHTGEPFKQETDENGITKSVKIKELEFNKSGVLEYGSMIVLKKENEAIEFEVVPQSMTNKLTRYNWKM
ncbi:MAG: metallophosphoesterase [Bacteroidia bacterium]|nr:metallophosphoesterase [Bacteroidia bacterium]